MACSGLFRRCGVRKGLVGGVLLLLLVDVIWVGSAGLTRVSTTTDGIIFVNNSYFTSFTNSNFEPVQLLKYEFVC